VDRAGHTVPTEENEATVAARIEDGTVEERAEGELSFSHDAAKLPSMPFSNISAALACDNGRMCSALGS
jgi:hypothetical protein